jgi:hypothetical protein
MATTSEKITEMTEILAAGVGSGYTFFPVAYSNNAPYENLKLSYTELLARIKLDIPPVAYQPAMLRLTPRVNPVDGTMFKDWVVENLIYNNDVYHTGSNFQITTAGIYKITCVVNMQYYMNSGYTAPYPIGLTEYGSYLERDNVKPARLIPPYGYQMVHSRYIPAGSDAATARPLLGWVDEFYIDFRDASDSAFGAFNVSEYFTSGNTSNVPKFDMAITIVRLS